MLHTISSANRLVIEPLIISKQDAVLFWQNGVIMATQNNPLLDYIFQQTDHCYILDNDIKARGLSSSIDPRLKIITMQQVIKLTTYYFPQINWE
ncbi:hypothetical protein A9G34_05280 [Gilliamella sp. Choc4-2]|uniref:sulfurtransferase complex subunit TusB n=1 Tax=unclassified Gilliamella TaxID=2685620 RepID=UPI00080DF79F|nr:sulfurtransferase complex subunit TusB [Gilliamella apicola]OCG29382.1 hypothetical protein A9G33_09985 [Gilliamella apicola]OCG46311.1 hypothetical protein A9G34_05280 [Gilliamella apicola]OCG55693.1 hypothetical protein A9G36_04625 [Gilliamella apicola]